MYDYEIENEDKALKSVGLELMFMTPEKCNSDDGITAVELAKRVELPVETVKKKLTILKDAGIIRVKGINPKYWKFDNYSFQRMDEDDEVYRLLCNFDDVDFDRFFQY
jgi:DNA-binding Lrp family transcriptional regulator